MNYTITIADELIPGIVALAHTEGKQPDTRPVLQRGFLHYTVNRLLVCHGTEARFPRTLR